MESADHVYGQTHPWPGGELPKEFTYVLDRTIKFLKEDKDKLFRNFK